MLCSVELLDEEYLFLKLKYKLTFALEDSAIMCCWITWPKFSTVNDTIVIDFLATSRNLIRKENHHENF